MSEPTDYYEFAIESKYPIRDLKFFAWIWDIPERKLVLYDKLKNEYFGVDRTRMFSLQRFCISVNQYLGRKHKK